MSIPIHLHGMIVPAKTRLWHKANESTQGPATLGVSWREEVLGLLAAKAEGLPAIKRNDPALWEAETEDESPDTIPSLGIERDVRERIKTSEGFIEDDTRNYDRLRRGDAPEPIPFCVLTLWECEGSRDYESGHFELDCLVYKGQGITTSIQEEGQGIVVPELPRLQRAGA